MKKNKLASVRGLFNITKGDMAKVIGVSPTTYSRKEGGEHDFKMEELIKIKNHINSLDNDKDWTMEDIFFAE